MRVMSAFCGAALSLFSAFLSGSGAAAELLGRADVRPTASRLASLA